MAITVDWPNKIINVPKADTTLVQSSPTEIRQLDLNQLRLTLKDLEDDEEGMVFETTHIHTPPFTVGGVELARVVEIINDYTITFEDGQYAVNLIGANSNVGDRVNVNQVSIRTANSAGLVTSAAIEYGEYGGGVTVDVINGVAGAIYPTGTRRQPSNNLFDAIVIANSRGFDLLYIIGDAALDIGQDLTGFSLEGESIEKSTITINPGAIVDDIEIREASILGTLDSNALLQHCRISTLSFFEGILDSCELVAGTITLGGTDTFEMINCYSGVAGEATPIIDLAGGGRNMLVRNFSGGLQLNNNNTTGNVSIDLVSGQVKLDSTITAGNYTIRGVGKLTDESSGNAIVNDSGLVRGSDITNIRHSIENLQPTGAAYGTTFYWDPVNGNDANAGLTPGEALKTFAACHSLVTDGNNDIIVGLGSSIIDEVITISKSHLHLRGSGALDFQIVPTTPGSNTVTITGNACTVAGVFISTAAGGTDHGLVVDGTWGVRLQDVKIEDCTGDGLRFIDSFNANTVSCKILSSGGTGVIYENTQDSIIAESIIDSNTVAGLVINDNLSGVCRSIDIVNNVFIDSPIGIQISTNNNFIRIRDTNRFTGNIPITVQDNGNDTHDERNSYLVRTGKAQGAGNGVNQIQLDASASSTNGAYDPALVTINRGTGAGQTRLILQYDGTTKIATVDRDWKIQPDATSEFSILPSAGREHVNEGLARGGSVNTITLNANASGLDDAYRFQTVFLRSGTGEDQVNVITRYDGNTKVATVDRNWSVIPDATTGYIMMPTQTYPTLTYTQTGFAQSGTSNTIQLSADASSLNGAYDPALITIIEGTGTGQTRLILQYDGTTKIAAVDRNWKVPPDATTKYAITPHPGREHVNEGLAQSGTISSITLNANASDVDNAYMFQTIFLRSGTGEDQVNIITEYDGNTKVATVDRNWGVIPDATTGYIMLPTQTYPTLTYIQTGFAQGSTVNTITLNTAASGVNGAYDPSLITITEGPGIGQTRLILQYDGTSKVATVDRDWKVAPTTASKYAITPHAGREHVNEGLAQGGTVNTITLNANASSLDDAYKYQTVFLRSGTGEDQVNLIESYDGNTKIATCHHNWGVIPDATTGYIMLPTHIHTGSTSEISNAVWSATPAEWGGETAANVMVRIDSVTGNTWVLSQEIKVIANNTLAVSI